jgi:hypothetical protein
VCEGKNIKGQVEKEDFNGKGVTVSIYGDIWIGHWKEGKRDGLVRYIDENGSA